MRPSRTLTRDTSYDIKVCAVSGSGNELWKIVEDEPVGIPRLLEDLPYRKGVTRESLCPPDPGLKAVVNGHQSPCHIDRHQALEIVRFIEVAYHRRHG